MSTITTTDGTEMSDKDFGEGVCGLRPRSRDGAA
jgi:hypothetical protein